MLREEELKKQASIYTDDADNYLEYSDDRGWTDKNDKEFVEKAFIEGAQWADIHPISPWNKYSEEKPEAGVEVIAFHHKWVDEDLNPNGTRTGFINGDGEFTSAYWWDYQDCYETINLSSCMEDEAFYSRHIDNTEPEMWMYIPRPPK